MQRLFVYGTLAPGRVNHHEIAHIEGIWQPATLRGHLLEQGWGATLGFPAIRPDLTAEPVAGYVLSANTLDAHWQQLDNFEGPGYQRQRVAVRIDSGAMLAAYVYALKEAGSNPHPPDSTS